MSAEEGRFPWNDAAAFYRERDDRTVLGAKEFAAYVHRPVELWVDPARAEDPTVQQVALVAANLTARWARVVTVIVPGFARLAEQLRRDGAHLLAERLTREMRGADPFGTFTVRDPVAEDCASDAAEVEAKTRTGPNPLRLWVGPWDDGLPLWYSSPDDDYQVHAASWTALGRRLGVTTNGEAVSTIGSGSDNGLHLPSTVAAAGLAGALGAGDLFKRAIGHRRDRSLPTFGWDTWDNHLTTGEVAWASVTRHSMVPRFDWGRTLLAGTGAVGSAIVYLADLMPQSGDLVVLDRDTVEVSNLNRSPLFTVTHVMGSELKAAAVANFLKERGVSVEPITGVWREHVRALSLRPFDLWISLTNEDGAWAELPFSLPPVVLHGTTTSGWGAAAGRHVPRREDCTLCRMPRPAAAFRSPCAEGAIAVEPENGSVRAALPFLSTVAASLTMAMHLRLQVRDQAVSLVNDVSVDLGMGLPWVGTLRRGPTPGCRGCAAAQSRVWEDLGGRGRFAGLSAAPLLTEVTDLLSQPMRK